MAPKHPSTSPLRPELAPSSSIQTERSSPADKQLSFLGISRLAFPESPCESSAIGLARPRYLFPSKGTVFHKSQEAKRKRKCFTPVESQEGTMASMPLQRPSPVATESPMILLVEDEARVRKVMAEVLCMEGYTVLESATAEHALTHPQLALSQLTV